MDHFLKQNARANRLGIDSIQFAKDIQRKDSINRELKQDKSDLRDIINTQQVITELWEADSKSWQDSSAYWKGKFTDEHKKVVVRNKIIFWETLANLAKDVYEVGKVYYYLKP